MWYTEGWNEELINSNKNQSNSNQCTKSSLDSFLIWPKLDQFYIDHKLPLVYFLGEQNILEVDQNFKEFFKRNSSYIKSELDIHGGYLKFDTTATCRDSKSNIPSFDEINNAKTLTFIFPVNLFVV